MAKAISQPARLRFCSTCLAMSTRPRISFDENGRCNACLWAQEKRNLDWSVRQQQLAQLINRHSKNGSGFDCLVPVSGGKDGSYVAHTLKQDYGLSPLCVTVSPPLPLEIGKENLESFIASGFNHLSVNVHPVGLRKLNQYGLVELGFPYFGWLTAIQSAVIRVGAAFGISLIFYGEDGEVEYGGTTETTHDPIYGVDYIKRIYLEGGHDLALQRAGLVREERPFFEFPEAANFIEVTHWSYFEDWDPYRNYLIAKEHCGLREAPQSNSGTFTNFAQNDQALYALHTYLMYLKFGFGRANQDACIEIRRGALTRQQGLNLVQMFDGAYPEDFMPLYLEYFGMTEAELEMVFDTWANKDLFAKVGRRWERTFDYS